MGRPDDPLALTQYLSSPVGTAAVAGKIKEVTEKLERFQVPQSVNIQLTIDSQKGISGNDAFLQSCVTLLERAQPPGLALLSYFSGGPSVSDWRNRDSVGHG
jgi:hypothetical protein